MNLLSAVRAAIRHHALIVRGDTVVVGVSGGPDSLCLLHVLRQLAPALEANLHVAHLHHGLRGAAADGDAEFVAQIASAWGLPCTVERVNVRELAARPGVSVEEAARIARYRFLGRVAATQGGHAVAVGHNADDQAETVLMHWLRGSGLAGLRGMTPKANLGDYRLLESTSPMAVSPFTVSLVRPLLGVPRADIERYCLAQGLQPRYDRSNEDTTLFRNRLRHELLPVLEGYNPQIRRVLLRTATVLGDDYDLLRTLVLEAWDSAVMDPGRERLIFDRVAWRALPPSLQRGVLREGISRLRRGLRNIDFGHVEAALPALREGQAGTRVTLPAGLELIVGYDNFAMGDRGLDLPIEGLPQLPVDRLDLQVGRACRLPESAFTLKVDLLSAADLPAGWQTNDDPWQAWLDADVVGPRPHLRVRREGDRFQPLGLEGRHKLLAEFFTNAKTPAAARPRWPLLVTTAGEIAWVCGLRVDERAKVTAETTDVLWLRFVPEQMA